MSECYLAEAADSRQLGPAGSLIPVCCRCLYCFSPCRQELRQMRASRDDGANFLLTCLADVRQQMLAEQGHAALAAAAPSTAGLAACGSQPAQLAQQQKPLEGGCSAVAEAAADRLESSSSMARGGAAKLLLADLAPQQRLAALQLLLEQLAVDWRDREGLVLPAAAPPGLPHPEAAAVGGDAVSPSAANSSGGGAYSPRCCVRASSTVASSCSTAPRTASRCTKSELMEMLLSEVGCAGGAAGHGEGT